jgi:alpha-glucosidase (family GH31 glycosyl hydrolase)
MTYTGPINFTVDAPLDAIPMFVRGGAIIPTQQVIEFDNQAPIDPLTFEIYPEGTSSRDYYEDDGISLDYQRGVYLHERITVVDDDKSVTIKATDLSGKYTPAARSLLLKVHAQTGAPKTIKLNGRELESVASVDALAKATTGEVYDSANKVLYVKFKDANAPFEVQIDK